MCPTLYLVVGEEDFLTLGRGLTRLVRDRIFLQVLEEGFRTDSEEVLGYRAGQGQATHGSGEDLGGSNQGTLNEDN